jgi:ribonuclease P protein component
MPEVLLLVWLVMPQFQRTQRLLTKSDFDRVFANGVKVVCGAFVLHSSVQTTAGNGSKLGLVVSKKVGNAVVRNRVKRQVREFFRHWTENPVLKSQDIVVIARPSASKKSNDELVENMRYCFGKLAKQFAVAEAGL